MSTLKNNRQRIDADIISLATQSSRLAPIDKHDQLYRNIETTEDFLQILSLLYTKHKSADYAKQNLIF